jgi:peroxiredoxin
VKDGDNIPYEVINYVEVDDPIPDFTVSDGEGHSFHSSEFKGKRSLLILYNTECPDCGKVLPNIDAIVWPAIKDNPGYSLITVSREEKAETVKAYWAKNRFTMPTYLDPHRNVFSLFANNTIPRLYIINDEGVVEWMAIGKLNISYEKLIAMIQSAG